MGLKFCALNSFGSTNPTVAFPTIFRPSSSFHSRQAGWAVKIEAFTRSQSIKQLERPEFRYVLEWGNALAHLDPALRFQSLNQRHASVMDRPPRKGFLDTLGLNDTCRSYYFRSRIWRRAE